MTSFSNPEGESSRTEVTEPQRPEEDSPSIEQQNPEAQLEQPVEGFGAAEEETQETAQPPSDPRDLWPRSPFYLRFPWILAGPLVAAMILWFGSGAVLSATIAAPRSDKTAQTSATKAQPTMTPAVATATSAPAAAQAPTQPALVLPPSSTPEATSTPRPTPTPFPMAVYNTDGQGVYLNRMAGGGERIKAEADRTILQVIGEDQQMYGQTWRNVRDPQGTEGWVPAQYLVDPSSLPAPTSTPTPRPATPTPTATAPASVQTTPRPAVSGSGASTPAAMAPATPAATAPATATPGAVPTATAAATSPPPTATPAAAATSAPSPSPTARP